MNNRVEYDYLEVVENYSNAYLNTLTFLNKKEIDKNTVKELGCLLLARIDGKSPVEYITDEKIKNVVRNISKSILLENYDSLKQVFNFINQQLQHLGTLK